LKNPLLKKVEQKGGLRGLCPRVDPNLWWGFTGALPPCGAKSDLVPWFLKVNFAK